MKCSSLGLSVLALAVLLQPPSANANKMNLHRYSGLNANANCYRQPFRICQGCGTTISMRVRQGRACVINFKSLGPFAGEQIVARPRHGLYGSANHTATAYHPNPGYVGQDYFETRLFFENGTARPTAMTLKVNVVVVP